MAGGISTYGYVGAAPLTAVDPLGLWELDISAYNLFGIGLNIRYSDGFIEITGRAGLGLGKGIAFDPRGTVSHHSKENCDDFGLIGRTSSGGSLGIGVDPLSRGVSGKATSGNIFGVSANNPRFPNFMEFSRWGTSLDTGRTGDNRVGVAASGHVWNVEFGFYRNLRVGP